jgi:autotransporter-associated beta strand protein
MVCRLRLVAAFASVFTAASLSAQTTVTWGGGFPDFLYTTPTNWQSGTTPLGDGSEILQLTDASSSVLQLNANAAFYAVNLAALSGGFPQVEINGPQGLTVNGGGIYVQGTAGGSSLTINVPITLGADQTWGIGANSGSLSVNGAVSGAFGIILDGDNNLSTFELGSSASTFTGGVHLEGQSATLWIGASGSVSSGPLGTGALLMDDGTTLSPGPGAPVTLDNPVTFGSQGGSANVRLGNFSNGVAPLSDLVLNGAITLNDLDLELDLGANTHVTFTNALNGYTPGVCLDFGTFEFQNANAVAILQGAITNVARLDIEDSVTVILDAPASGVLTSGTAQVTNLEDIGVDSSRAYLGLGGGYSTAGYVPAFLSWMDTSGSSENFAGTLGFDTTTGSVVTFNDPVDLSSFTNDSFVGLGSATTAILGSGAVITPPGGWNGTVYPFGGGGGILQVESALGDGGSARSLNLEAGGAPLTLVLSGGLTYTGGTTVNSAALIFDTPPPSTGPIRLGTNGQPNPGYAGSTANSGYTDGASNIQSFINLVGSSSLNGVIGFDEFGGTRVITSAIDLSALGSDIYLGSATSVEFEGAITPNASSNSYPFSGVKGGFVQVDSNLSGAGTSLVAGLVYPLEGASTNSTQTISTVILAGANTYGGGTILYSGALDVTNSSALGTGPLVVPQAEVPTPFGWTATLSPYQGAVTVPNDIELSDDGLSLNPGGTHRLTLTGAITALEGFSGSLGIFGPVTLSGTSANTYSGGTVIQGAVVVIAKDSGLGTGNIQATNSTLHFTSASPVLAPAGETQTNFNGSTVTFSGNPVINALGMVQTAIAFNGATATINGFTGDNPGDGNSIALATNTTLTWNNQNYSDGSDGSDYNGTITGNSTNSLLVTGGGNLDLRGMNTYGGGTTVDNNTLVIASTNLALGTGSVSINSGGVVALNSGVTLTNPITLAAGSPVGGAVAGFGTFAPSSGGITLSNGATVDPGSGQLDNGHSSSLLPIPGKLSFGAATTVTFGPGGQFLFSLTDASGAAGTGYGTIDVPGTLSITANAGAPFEIYIFSYDPSTGQTGNAANFNAAGNYSWTLASAGSITNFNATYFNVVSANFLNGPGSGHFYVSESGNELMLNFTPVPEPATWAMVAVGTLAIGAGAVARRRRA